MVHASFGRWPGLLLGAASVLGLLAACDKTKATADAPTAPGSSRPESTETPPPVESSKAPPTPPPPSEVPVNMPTAEKTKAIAAGSNAFAFELWARTRKSAKDNFALSPASISMAFAMTYGGAKGETAAQMKKVFHFPEEPAALMASWGGLGRALSDPSRPITLRVANRLFGDKTYGFEQAYVDRTRTAFGAATRDDTLYEAVSEGRRHPGLEHWLPLFYEGLDTLFDYVPGVALAFDPLAEDAAGERLAQIKDYYEARRASPAIS